MTRAAKAISVGLFVLASATSVDADPIVINFDEQTPGTKAPDLYLSLGVFVLGFISGVGVDGSFAIAQTADATSPPNAAFGRRADRDIGAQFLLEGPGFRRLRAATDFVSFSVVGTDAGQIDPWRALFYGLNGDVLGTFSGTTNGLVSLRRPAPDIHQFVLFNTESFEGVDDLSFNSPVVPEPSTLILVGSGLIVAVRSVRRRYRQGDR
jgi:PEP-CTERM motif